jgi:hypothetical protein
MLLYLVKIVKFDLPRIRSRDHVSSSHLCLKQICGYRIYLSIDNYISLSKEHVIKPITISGLQAGINLPDLDILVDYV